MEELFKIDDVSSKSPKLKWMEQHAIQVEHKQDGWVDEYSEERYSYIAFKIRKKLTHGNILVFGYGNTEDDALFELAKKIGILLWNEESR